MRPGLRIKNFDRFTKDPAEKPKLQKEAMCPDCESTDAEFYGSRTADPWSEDEGKLYHVEGYTCKNCGELFEVWDDWPD